MGIKLSKVAKTAKKYDHILIIMRHAKAEPFGDKGDSERERLDLLNLGLSPASIVIMGSNKPFDEWQVHSGELLAVINVKDFD